MSELIRSFVQYFLLFYMVKLQKQRNFVIKEF